MIGQLQIHVARRPVTAQLQDDLHWTCADPHVADMLNLLFGAQVHEASDPEPSAFARHLLFRAGARLGANVKLHHATAGAVEPLQLEMV
jgi:hypothetical protein